MTKKKSSFKDFMNNVVQDDPFISHVKDGYARMGLELKPKNVKVQTRIVSGSIPKQCYNNSFRYLLSHSSAMYVLGYVFVYGVPIEHAWVKDGSYFDVTLDASKQDGYLSMIEFPFISISAYVNKYGHAPGLFDMAQFISKS